MSNLPVFLTGLASGPVIAAAAWMLAQAVHAVIRWWPKRPPLVIHDDDFRVRNADIVAALRRWPRSGCPAASCCAGAAPSREATPANDVVNGIRHARANPSPPATET